MAADLSALTFMDRLGYDPQGLTDYMETLAKEQTGGAGQGVFATHPGMTVRSAKARSVIAEKKWPRTTHSARDRRLQQALG